MKIVFESAEIHNFLAIGDATVNFDNQGFVVISGANKCLDDGAKSNGAGKSTIFDALLWCLTGETIRGTKDVSNIYTGDGAVVRVQLAIDDVPYTILRTKDNSEYKTSLKLYKDGVDISGKGIRETADVIAQRLPGVTADILRSVVIFGQGLPDRISNNTPSGRKQVLERLSKSDFMIDDLKNRVADRIKVVKDSLRNLEDRLLVESMNIENGEKDISVIDTDIASIKSDISNLDDIPAKEGVLRQIKGVYAELQSSVAKTTESLYNAREKYLSTSAQKASELATIDASFAESIRIKDAAIAEERGRLAFIESKIKNAMAISDICPTCHQKIFGVVKPDISSEVSEKETLLSDIESRAKEIENLWVLRDDKKSQAEEFYNGLLSGIKSDGESIKAKLDALTNEAHEIQVEMENKEKELIRLESLITSAQSRLSELRKRRDNAEEQLAKNKQSKTYIEVERDETQKRCSALSAFSTAIARDFRGYLLAGVVDYIRKCARKYAAKLFGASNIMFEQDGNNLNIGYNGKLYENLSGGERQKVDIVMQLAVRDMLCNYLGFSCNLLVLDEVTDNLDDVGCAGVMQLITDDLSDIQSVFIISHRANSLDIPYDKELCVTKEENGVSNISER